MRHLNLLRITVNKFNAAAYRSAFGHDTSIAYLLTHIPRWLNGLDTIFENNTSSSASKLWSKKAEKALMRWTRGPRDQQVVFTIQVAMVEWKKLPVGSW